MESILSSDAADAASNRALGLAAIHHRLDLSADMTDKKSRDILQEL